MASLNRVLLIGNLTKDPELRYTPSGTAIAKFRLAINREFTDKQGEKREDTCFVDISAWGRQGEICNQYLRKGRSVFIEGRLEFSAWETKEGDKRSKIEVVAERVQFLGGPRDGNPGDGASGGGGEDAARRDGGGGSYRGRRQQQGAVAGAGAAARPEASDARAGDGGDDLDLGDIPF